MEATAPSTAPQPPSSSILLRRPNSTASSVIIPAKLPHLASSSPSLDLQIVSLSKYTSIKDLLPSPAAAVNSPKDLAPASEICIRNRVVKHAACAYLQPVSSSQEYSGHHFLRRLCLRFSDERNLVTVCFSFIRSRIIPFIARAFDCLIQRFES